jgi:uridine phosphorylase
VPERLHHLDLAAGDVGRYALLPGDPARVPVLASFLEGATEVASKREYATWAGRLDGELVAVTSTGIGCPSAAIAVEEVATIGVDTVIRVGTAGGMQPETLPGDLVVASAAIRDEGTSRQYLPAEFPAVADLDVTVALREAAAGAGVRHHVGVVHSKDSFYGQREPERMPVADELSARWRAWKAGGALCSEMEAAAILVVASTLGLRAGGLMLVAGNQELSDAEPARDDQHIRMLAGTAVTGLRRLIARDRA